jgi:four helix bundle protein
MPRKQFTFERLEVWQDARKLVIGIYESTRDFPKAELYGMTSQLNRAAVSVANNLAEGTSRASMKDQAHFSNQAYSSLMETVSDLIISTDLGFIQNGKADILINQAHDLAVRIHNLRESQLRRSKTS